MDLWSHQKEALERVKNTKFYGLFWEPGTGKTRTACHILEQKCTNHGRILPTLIVCPLIVVEQWAREFQKYSCIPMKHICALRGTGKQKLFQFIGQMGRYPTAIVITNYESLLNNSLYEAILKWNPRGLICDEAHKLKSNESKRTSLVYAISRGAYYRFILTGTPVLNTPMDLFSQMLILDHGESFGNNFYQFRAKYFYDANSTRKGTGAYFPMWLPRKGINEEFAAKLDKVSMRVRKGDVLDLPPLVKQEVIVELNTEQRRVYDSMEKSFIAFLKERVVTADLAITKALRLQQIVSGFIKDENEKELDFEENPRISALRELLENIAPYHKVIVWAVFKRNYRQIAKVCDELQLGYTELHGEIHDKDANVQKFYNDDNCRVLIGHPGSGGLGVNLVCASYSIFYSRGFSLEFEIQAESRNHRGGSKEAGHEKITRIDIIAKDTIDEIILKALQAKAETSHDILDSNDTKKDILEAIKDGYAKRLDRK